jgi:glutamate-1-semialdehyde aminotransferase
MNKGQDLYKKAKKIIPGGTMLLSKRPEMFIPENWPSYFSKSKGCFVWDLDGKKYTDMSIMGIGTNTLGYGHDEVDSSVLDTIKNGNMSTLNCPEEVYLAEKLLEINDWADSVRFCRAGGEANALAIRIARAASGKDKVAICGYHGWHDWYISVNHNSLKGLDDHLLPGLKPKGVPKNLKDTVYPFTYNDYEQLLDICDNNDIGVIKMEVIRNFGPENDFLQKVRNLATQRGIVLVFDECTSGFRETFGGIHKKFSVNPDIAMFGKTIGNGYALTAVVGIEEVMKSAEDTFISSTFWTERIGPTAALKTLEVMENIESWNIITDIGKKVRSSWSDLFKKYNIDFLISGIPSLSSYTFKKNDLEIQTLISQEMLRKGFLASNRFYACIAHNNELLDSYFNALDETLSSINNIKDNKTEIINRLNGPVRHSGFKRLN